MSRGVTRSLEALRGKPAVVLLWSPGVPAPRRRSRVSSAVNGVDRRALAPLRLTWIRASGLGRPLGRGQADPEIAATPEVSLSYTIAYRHLFMNRQPLQLPTWLLLDAAGRIVRVYREADVAQLARDAGAIEIAPDSRLRERCRSRARSTRPCRSATTCRTAASSSTRGSSRPRSRRSSSPPGRVPARPRCTGWERSSRRRGDRPRARCLREGAGSPAGPRRSQQRSRGAARAVGRCRGRDRAVPCRARFDA